MPEALAFINERYGHISFTWKDSIFVVGGQYQKVDMDPSWLHFHFRGEWMKKQASGDVPYRIDRKICTAQVSVYLRGHT